MILNGWLWTAYPFQRISLDGQTVENLPTPRDQSKYQHVPTCLQAVGDGQRVLVGDPCGLWLLELEAGATPKRDASGQGNTGGATQ